MPNSESVKRVLIADDNPGDRGIYVASLEYAPFEYVLVGNGTAALAFYWKERTDPYGRPFDMMVLDAAMPDKSGLKVAEMVRKAGDSTTVIVILSGTQEPYIDARAKDCCTAVWGKDSNMDGWLMNRIKEMLDAI